MESTSGHSGMAGSPGHARLSPVLAENVRHLRKAANISKKWFALMVGIGRPFLDKIEGGTADPRLSVVVKMADALETMPSELPEDPRQPGGAGGAADAGVARHARLGSL